MRHALLGGTFDPFHNGHLWLVDAVLAHAGCEHVWVVPAASPPHKPDPPRTAFAHRLAMCEAALQGHPAVSVSDCEAHRQGPSYTVDTLRTLVTAVTWANAWVLVLGADQAAEFHTWRDPDAIRSLAELAVAARPGVPAPEGVVGGRVLPGDPPAVSATEIRRRVRAGEPIDTLVPAAVAAYIDAHRLYRGDPA